ncbi:sugar ABC transporter ATP-binding protein [Alkalicoccus urumqiensis]|uniref:D-xylose ABC transporter ATP-binding protein n=1 Tax=Alkalicoccus urumqiensis TaxID=1548213 RepID=A0A2P6ML84_ALKUR|nr:sugar ABC transporter ATP-binding protein [Alkalicoccus urumqiensis]PRO67042.1 D-xylose ABC transporter ATP-binding protein [Alkalicoccus urumqiensis]
MTLLTMKNITKEFFRVPVLHGVDLEIDRGEIVALLGENGAGKSTLMKIIAGVHEPTSGSIYLDGEEVTIDSPSDSQHKGISIIHQEFNLLPDISIMENIFLGRLPRKWGSFVRWNEMKEKTKALLERVGIGYLAPETSIRQCSIAEQQLIEIAKALSFDAELLIMDEPTATLNNEETERLLQLMEELKNKGMGVIFITHRLNEVMHAADRAVILRDGEFIGVKHVEETTQDELVAMMVGRELTDMFPEKKNHAGEEVLRVEHLHVKHQLEDIHFSVAGGEILGIAGLMGCGKSELSRALFGLYKLESGKVQVNGSTIQTPKDAIDAGLALVTDDRKSEGLVLDLSVAENILLPNYRLLSKRGVLPKKQLNEVVNVWFGNLAIKASSPQVEVNQLSGGNQQKVVLGKWLQTNPKVLILNEPTRGIDIGAKAEIYKRIERLAEEGMAIVLISSEMPEVLGLADRILVMSDGRISGELDRQEATQEKIFEYAIGGGSNG